jgi:hypothetical protein
MTIDFEPFDADNHYYEIRLVMRDNALAMLSE